MHRRLEPWQMALVNVVVVDRRSGFSRQEHFDDGRSACGEIIVLSRGGMGIERGGEPWWC
jgi:hypothetical protein